MNIVVLGASGFMGRSLCKHLAGTGSNGILAVSRSITEDVFAGLSGRVRTLQHDLVDGRPIPRDIFRSDVIVDMASVGPTAESLNAIVGVSRTARRHLGFVQRCIEAGFAGRYVYISSGGAIYGNPEYTPVRESHPTYPLSPYGYEKLLIETHLLRHEVRSKLNLVILRPGNVYGSNQVAKRGFGIVPTIYERMVSAQPITIYGSGSSGERDYVYETDLDFAIEVAFTVRQSTDNIYNIGSGQGTSTLAIAKTIETLLGTSPTYSFAPARDTDVSGIVLDCRHAAENMGWRPRVSFDEGIARTVKMWSTAGGGATLMVSA